jgi:hypothetical protein
VAAGTLRGGSAGARDGRCAITPPYLAAAPLILALLTIRMTRSLYNHHVTPKGRIRWLTRALRNGRFRRRADLNGLMLNFRKVPIPLKK